MRVTETEVERCRMMDRIPNLEFDEFVINVDHVVVHGLEPLVHELQQQARLPHTCEQRANR
jgi:hypothetical protein